MVNLPKKIDPCPIVEAILEIRFSSPLPEDAIFGVLYNEFKDEYPKFEQLPILQLPAALRVQDPNLRYNAHYKTQKDNFILQTGPRSFSFSNIEPYVGWDVFSKNIFATYEKVIRSGVIEKIERIGLRYINILEGVNIFENSNFVLSLIERPINRKTTITTEIPFDKATCQFKAISDAEAKLGGQDGKKVTGSVLDLDVIVDVSDFESVEQAIEHAHNVEKELFYSVLKTEFIKTLNPEY